jgi:hypothetical protein
VQNCEINPDFDLFLQRKNGGPSPRAVDRARVAGCNTLIFPKEIILYNLYTYINI